MVIPYATLSGTLPVRFLNFSAVRQASNVIVTWGVGAEDAVNSYELEVSTNGSSFSRIAMKASQGSSSYDYIDQNVARYNAKKLYYRVKQLDKDGAFTYSPVKTIRLDVKGSIALYPNPAREGFTLNIPYLQANDQRVVLQLVNRCRPGVGNQKHQPPASIELLLPHIAVHSIGRLPAENI
jgi:hypothetical protein